MTWQGTGTAGLAAEGPEQREGWRRLSVLLRDGKSRPRSGCRKTREERHCEASGGAAGFRASRVLRGCVARALHGEAQGFRLRTTNTARTRGPQTKHDVSARSRFEGMAPEQRASQKARSRRRLETSTSGSAFGEADRASQHPLRPRSRRQRGAKRRSSVASVPSSLKLRSACKAGRSLLVCPQRHAAIAVQLRGGRCMTPPLSWGRVLDRAYETQPVGFCHDASTPRAGPVC